MMKKLFYSLMALLFVVSCTKQPAYKITGNINGMAKGEAVLNKVVDNKLVAVDSVEVIDGAFTLKGAVTEPELYVLTFADTLQGIQLFVENKEITIKADVDSIYGAEITGSDISVLFKNYTDELLNYNMKFKSLYNEYMQAQMGQDFKKVKEIEEEYSSIEKEQVEYIKNFIKENSASILAPYITLSQLAYRLEANELEEFVNGFSPELAEHKYTKELSDRLSVMKKVAIGQPFVDFTLNDPEGNPVALSSYIGEKYVLLDFWAAWCNPCRQENPNLVNSYAKYKDKGFEIFGVSFDKTKEAWLAAIEKDGITWPQVSDLKYWNSEAGKLYAVRSIPHNVLIDKDGIIIAKNLKGEDLGNKLAELLD